MSRLRIGMTTLLALVATAIMAPAAEASFGAAIFEAGTCNAKPCTYKKIEEHSGEQFTQAAGHPNYGITSFELKYTGSGGSRKPEGALKRLRVDVPAGLAADPQAVEFCTRAQFEGNACPENTQVGTTELEAAATILGITDVLKLEGTVYNLERKPGLPLEFGIKVAPAEPLVTAVHLYLEGHLSDGHEPSQAVAGVPSGDYHEYFEINEVPKEAEILGGKVPLEVIKSKLLFEGTKGGNFLTLPSVCSSTTTSYLEVESYEGAISHSVTHTPVGVEGCGNVPFKPTAEVKAATSTSDQPDGATTIVKVPQKSGSTEINTADIKDAHVTLPEGMTLNPPAANGLETCSPAQIAIGSAGPASCPAASKVGTVTTQTDLPPNSLSGSVYLGNPAGGKITKPPFTIYLDAESSTYGVSVKLQGTATPNPVTGRLEVSFLGNPQLPFSELILTLNGGPRAPLANPLSCGGASTQSNFAPYTGGSASLASTPFTTTGCASPLPFALAQSTSSTSSVAGAYAAYTFNLTRGDGQQYLKELKTVLPAGLVGDIPSVPLCPEPAAQKGECPEASKIGTAAVTVGAGSEPYPFSGPVYLTGPYNGAPYGLSIPVEAAAGPFDLGRVTTRVSLGVDPYTSRIVASAGIPTIVEGVPLRLKSLSVSVNRSDFLFNPTNCNPMATDSVLSSTFDATQAVSSPFQLTDCSALAFKPRFSANTSALATKKLGDSLVVSLTQPAHEANIRSVVAQLPLQLPSRLSTLQKACPEATFNANPAGCPKESKVGTATVKTPVLADPLSGPAYFVSHGGAAFPDLDLILQGNGVTVILVGNTNIRGGITTSTFASIPDVPVSSFSLSLPTATNSVLAAYGNLCLKPLLMPTTITAQSGAVFKQSTRISVSSCGIRILSHRVVRHTLILRVRTLGGGLVTVKGKGLPTISKRVSRSTTLKFRIPLTKGGLRLLRKHPRGGLTVGVNVGFRPAKKGATLSAASTTIKFKH
jgi:hypothetical protein